MFDVLSCDVGTRNLGFCGLNTRTRQAHMERVDLHVLPDGREVEMQERILHACAESFVNERHVFFQHAKEFGVEKQMKSAGGNLMKQLQAHLVSYVRGRYPHLRVHVVCPRSVRAFMDTHGRNYRERKLLSKRPRVMSAEDKRAAETVFRDRVDPLEAAHICLYLEKSANALAARAAKYKLAAAPKARGIRSQSVRVTLHPPLAGKCKKPKA